MGEAWTIDAARTPRGIGKAGQGALSSVHPQRMLPTVLKALEQRNGLNTVHIDDVVIGCFAQTGLQDGCIARQAVLDAGWGPETPGFTVSRYCGSGLTAFNQAVMGYGPASSTWSSPAVSNRYLPLLPFQYQPCLMRAIRTFGRCTRKPIKVSAPTLSQR